MYEDVGLVSTHILLSWFSSEGIGVSSRLVLSNIVTIGWCLHVLLSWFLVKEIGVSIRLVLTIFVTVGWCLKTFINISLWFYPDWVSTLNSMHCDFI
jgi:hypothetical protein